MDLTINQLPKKWKPGNFFAFSKWYKQHVKSPFKIEEDYYLINRSDEYN